jgi:hypothetical protein
MSVLVSVSHPVAGMRSQSPKPALHVIAQVPPAHALDALARTSHTAPHIPQCALLVLVSTQAPEQLLCPIAQPLVHMPVIASQLGVAPEHTRPHVPQWEGDESEASQPFAAIPSQSAKPGAHAFVQRPAAQEARWFGPAAHAAPHDPQWVRLVLVSVSQPFAGIPSQSAKGATHVFMQRPVEHDARWLAPAEQAIPHAPQFITLDCVSASQPLTALRSQSAKPIVHVPPHTPITHARAPLGKSAHSLSHRPQCCTLLAVVTHVAPQRVSPAPHELTQVRVAELQFGRLPLQVIPQRPQSVAVVRSVSQPFAALRSQSSRPLSHC